MKSPFPFIIYFVFECVLDVILFVIFPCFKVRNKHQRYFIVVECLFADNVINNSL